MDNFKDYAHYYDLFYREKAYDTEAKTVSSLLQKYHPNCHSVLNLGCGTGKHDNEFNKLGYKVTGIDLSEEMVEIAKKNYPESLGKGLEFYQGDIRNLNISKKYDAVISLFHVFSYQNRNEDILSALKTAYSHLEDNGILLFDCWYGPGVLTDLPAVRIKRIHEKEEEVVRQAVPMMHWNHNVVDVCYNITVLNTRNHEYKSFDEVHKMRYFFQPEMEHLLEEAGFSFVTCIDCDTLLTPNHESWTVYFVAVKKECK